MSHPSVVYIQLVTLVLPILIHINLSTSQVVAAILSGLSTPRVLLVPLLYSNLLTTFTCQHPKWWRPFCLVSQLHVFCWSTIFYSTLMTTFTCQHPRWWRPFCLVSQLHVLCWSTILYSTRLPVGATLTRSHWQTCVQLLGLCN